MFALFFPLLAELDAVARPQDAAGGEVPTPSAKAAGVPCSLQQNAGPERTEPGKQKRHGSSAAVSVFFATDPALKPNDRIRVSNAAGQLLATVVVDGPAFDSSGQASGIFAAIVAWEARGVVVT